MKINETQRLRSVLSAYQQNEVKRSTAAKPASRRDEVHISEEAKKILMQSGEATDLARLDKIGQLKESVASGNYQVDSKDLADRMLPFLLGKRGYQE